MKKKKIVFLLNKYQKSVALLDCFWYTNVLLKDKWKDHERLMVIMNCSNILQKQNNQSMLNFKLRASGTRPIFSYLIFCTENALILFH